MSCGTLVFDPAQASGAGQGLITAGTPTLISRPVRAERRGPVSFAMVFVGSLVGVLTVEYSNSIPSAVADGSANWDTYNPSSLSIPAVSGAMKFAVELDDYGMGWARLKFVTTSGTGTVQAESSVKEG